MTPKPDPPELTPRPPGSDRDDGPSPEQLASILRTVGVRDDEPCAVYAVREDQPHLDVWKGDLLIELPDNKVFLVRYRFSREFMSYVAAQGLKCADSKADVEAMLWFWRRMFMGYPSRRARLEALASQDGRTPRDLLNEALLGAIVEVMSSTPTILQKVPGLPSDILRKAQPIASPTAGPAKPPNPVPVGDLVRAVLRAADRELYRLANQPPTLELEAVPELPAQTSTGDLLARLELDQTLDMLRRPAPRRIRRLIDLLREAPELWEDREELARRLGIKRNNADQLVHELKQIARLGI